MTCVDINPDFVKYVNKIKSEHPQLTFENVVTTNCEDLSSIASETFDVVVVTHVLCSTKRPEKVVDEAKRVLKPDGRFLLLEHVGNRNSFLIRTAQKLLENNWSVYTQGG